MSGATWHTAHLEARAPHVDVGHDEVPVAGEEGVPAHGPLAAHGLGAGAAVAEQAAVRYCVTTGYIPLNDEVFVIN